MDYRAVLILSDYLMIQSFHQRYLLNYSPQDVKLAKMTEMIKQMDQLILMNNSSIRVIVMMIQMNNQVNDWGNYVPKIIYADVEYFLLPLSVHLLNSYWTNQLQQDWWGRKINPQKFHLIYICVKEEEETNHVTQDAFCCSSCSIEWVKSIRHVKCRECEIFYILHVLHR